MFTQAELQAATRKGRQATLALFQREYDSGFNRSPSASMIVGPGGKLQRKPDTWLEKYGWTLPLMIEAAGVVAPFAGGSAAAGSTTGLSAPLSGLPLYSGSGALVSGGSAAATTAGATTAAKAGAGMGWKSTAIDKGIDLFSSLFGAHQQSKAQDEATRLEIAAEQKIAEQNAAASKYAADLQAKSSADALAFSRSGAENAFQNSEVSRQGNYDQWSAAQRRLGGVAHLIGMPDREIPTYRPGVDPHFDNGAGGPGGPAAPSGPPPSIDPSKGDLAGQISAYFKSRGVSDSETPYWVSKWSEFGANDPAYFNSRLAAADIFGRGGAPQAPPQASPKPLNYNLSQYI